MSNAKELVKNRWREYQAKPALLRRRDATQQFLGATWQALGREHAKPWDCPFPSQEQGVESFRLDYWAAEMWSKYPFEIEGIDRASVATQKFLEAETLCASANHLLTDGFSRPWPAEVRSALKKARRNICKLVGGITLDEVVQGAGWGPGATTSMRRIQASAQHKWEFGTHATIGALPYCLAFNKWAGIQCPSAFEVVSGNRITTVPKNAKTDRCIAIEPDWNMFFQLGFGKALRRRLNRVGLLVEDPSVGMNSQRLNQSLARLGSRDNTFGTIDLASASDSVSLALCELLLPRHLFEHLLNLRSPEGCIGDRSVQYEKISSMGNGCTFELETLIFWGLSTAFMEAGAVVYGDDIIVDNREIGLRLIELLEFCGFKVNPKKTFLDGPFRESCGGHYFNGIDVTPPYVRKKIASLDRYISTANSLQRRVSQADSLVDRFIEPWRELVKEVPRAYRGPLSAGDVCLWARFDSCAPTYHRNFQTYVGLGLSKRFPYEDAPQWGGVLASLWSGGMAVTSVVPEFANPQFNVVRWISGQWKDELPLG